MNKVMKELSIEEKAKAYDRALEAVKRLLEVNPSDEGIQNWVNENFPELCESKDERIRKALIEHFRWNVQQILNNFDNKEVLAWLEKQVEQKDVCIDIKDNQELPNKEETEVSDEYQQGYRNGFKCGKEYVEKYPQEFNLQPMQLIQECEHENLIKERLTNAVNICYTEDGGKEAPFKEELIAYINKNCEWSEEDENTISEAEEWLDTLCDYLKDSSSAYIPNVRVVISNLKSLKCRVQPKPKQGWNKEDEYNYEIVMYCLNNQCVGAKDKENAMSWFKSLKDRVQPKQKWSEEDEEQLNRSLYMMEQLDMTKSWDDVYNWLKSLKERYTWKPSEYQLKSLQAAIDIIGEQTLTGTDLKELLEQLNKL